MSLEAFSDDALANEVALRRFIRNATQEHKAVLSCMAEYQSRLEAIDEAIRIASKFRTLPPDSLLKRCKIVYSGE